MKLVLSRWPGFTPSDVCDILLTGLHGVGGTAGASVQRGESFMSECISRPGICHSYNSIVIAGASVQRGESFMSECISRPGICHSYNSIVIAGASVQRG